MHKAPHSAILAPCHAIPGSTPFIIGRAAIIAVSVVLPAIMISGFSFKASIICSAPAKATIFEHLEIISYEISGAFGKGLMFPLKYASDTILLSCEDLITTILSDWFNSLATSLVISKNQSTALSAPQVPAVPINSGIFCCARASIKPFHSALVEVLEYFETP